MKTTRFSTMLLTAIALCLVALVFENWQFKTTSVYAAPLPSHSKYEYKTIVRARDVDPMNHYSETVTVDGKKIDGSTDILELFNSLGAQGWQLIIAEPRALGGWSGWAAQGGATTNELFVFQRDLR